MTATMDHHRMIQVAATIALGVAVPAMFWIAGGAVSGLVAAGWGWAVLLAFHIGNRHGEVTRVAPDPYAARTPTRAADLPRSS